MTLLTIIAPASPTALAVSELRSSVIDDRRPPEARRKSRARRLRASSGGGSVMALLHGSESEDGVGSTVRRVQGRFQSDGASETEALGGRLASELSPGDVVLIEGELGAGKTTFVRG